MRRDAQTAPLTIGRSLGDGSGLLNRTGPTHNTTASYGSTGPFLAQCIVTDGLGIRAVAASVVPVSPRPPFAWVTASVVLSAGTMAAPLLAVDAGLSSRPRDQKDRSSAMAQWVPPTDPAKTVHGTKVCPKGGGSKVPPRRTCVGSGAPLPRDPGR